MKRILGALLIIVGVCAGLYVGVYLCFIGGIQMIIDEVKSETYRATGIGLGIVRIMFSAFAGWLSAFALVMPGFYFLFNKSRPVVGFGRSNSRRFRR